MDFVHPHTSVCLSSQEFLEQATNALVAKPPSPAPVAAPSPAVSAPEREKEALGGEAGGSGRGKGGGGGYLVVFPSTRGVAPNKHTTPLHRRAWPKSGNFRPRHLQSKPFF